IDGAEVSWRLSKCRSLTLTEQHLKRCESGFHAAPAVSGLLSTRLELARWCPKRRPHVLTEPCNFADRSCNLAIHLLSLTPSRPPLGPMMGFASAQPILQAGEGTDREPRGWPQDVSIRRIYARCCSQLAARRGSRDSAASEKLRGSLLSC